MYPTGYLKNEKTGRFHPILFRPAPPPSGDDDLMAQRYRSIGHHTDGFDSIEAAHEFVKNETAMTDVGVVWSWDGEGIPAMTEWFSMPKIAA